MPSFDIPRLRRYTEICLGAVARWNPIVEIDEDGQGIVLPQEDMGIRPSEDGAQLVVWAMVTTPGTRWEPPDGDIADLSTHTSETDAAMGLVLAMLRDRMEAFMEAESMACAFCNKTD